MAIIWGVTAMNYYLISYYLIYIPGNIYVNTSIATISELLAQAISGIVYVYVGEKWSFILSFALSALGGVLIGFIPAGEYLVAFFVFVAVFGISFSYNLVYLVTPYLFPTERSSTAFGVCNASAMIFSILSGPAAVLPGVWPMVFYSATSIFAILGTLFLNVSHKEV